MSTKSKSTKRQSNLRMVFLEGWEDFLKITRLIREGKITRPADPNFMSLKTVSLLEKEGVKFRRVLKPIAMSDLTLEQKEDLKNKRANLVKNQNTNLSFFVKYKPEDEKPGE